MTDWIILTLVSCVVSLAIVLGLAVPLMDLLPATSACQTIWQATTPTC